MDKKNIQTVLELMIDKNYSQALDILEEIIFDDENNIEAHFKKGECLLLNNEHTSAIDEFKLIIELVPDNLNAHLNLVKAYIGSYYFNEAMETLEELEKINPDYEKEEVILLMAICYKELDNIEKANENLVKVIEINKNKWEAFNLLGKIQFDEGNYFKAIEFLEKSYQIKKDPISLKDLIDCYSNIENYEKSIECCEIFLKEFKDHEDINDIKFNKSSNLNYLGLYDESIILLKEIISSIDDKNLKASRLVSLSQTYNYSGDYNKALNTIDSALELCQKDNIYVKKGDLLRFNKEYDKAIECYEKANKIKETSQHWELIARTYQDKGELEKSLEIIDKCINMEEGGKSYLISSYESLKCDILKKMNKDESIILQSLLKSVELNPTGVLSIYNLAAHYRKNNEYEKELELYLKAFNLDKSKPFADNIASCYEKLKMYDKALEFHDIAISQEPKNYDRYNDKAECLKKMDRVDDGLKIFDKLIEEEKASKFALSNVLFNKASYCQYIDDEYDKIAAELFCKAAIIKEELNKSKFPVSKLLKPDEIDYDEFISPGNFYYRGNLYEKAINYYKCILKDYPNLYDIQINLEIADCLMQLEKYSEAMEIYEKLKDTHDNPYNYFYNMGRCHYYLDDYKKSNQCYEELIKIVDNKDYYMSLIAENYNKMGKKDEAIKMYDEAIILNPNSEEYKKKREIIINKLA